MHPNSTETHRNSFKGGRAMTSRKEGSEPHHFTSAQQRACHAYTRPLASNRREIMISRPDSDVDANPQYKSKSQSYVRLGGEDDAKRSGTKERHTQPSAIRFPQQAEDDGLTQQTCVVVTAPKMARHSRQCRIASHSQHSSQSRHLFAHQSKRKK